MAREELYPGVIGMQIEADTTREGVIDDGNVAWPDRIFEARRQWPEARLEDFEKVGKRLWRDKASGVEYRQAHGAPLLDIGTDATRFISCFIIVGGSLVFLERSDIPQGRVLHHGEFYGAQVINGRIVKEGSA